MLEYAKTYYALKVLTERDYSLEEVLARATKFNITQQHSLRLRSTMTTIEYNIGNLLDLAWIRKKLNFVSVCLPSLLCLLLKPCYLGVSCRSILSML